jgi:hypothetical protein
MRKLFLMLAVLLVASAAYAADVTISCTADGNVVTVSYEASAEANIPRAFSLDIQLSTDATITDVTPLDPNYWVYPGSYGDDPCTPVGDPCDSDDTLPGEDSNGLTIEMASLHSPPEVNSPNAPDISNALLSFKVSGSGDCNVYISGNAARGKVVFYDATNEDDGRDVVYTGCTVEEEECFPSSHPDYSEWVAVGKPDSWCYPKQCHGDATGTDEEFGRDNWVSVGFQDFQVLLQGYNKNVYTDPDTHPWIAADFTHSEEEFGRDNWVHVGFQDFQTLLSYYNDAESTVPADCLD